MTIAAGFHPIAHPARSAHLSRATLSRMNRPMAQLHFVPAAIQHDPAEPAADSLSLATDYELPSLRFERRGYPRKKLEQNLVATYELPDGQVGIVRMKVIEASWVGLGALCDNHIDLPEGTKLSLCAPGVPVPTKLAEIIRNESTRVTIDQDGKNVEVPCRRLGIKITAPAMKPARAC